MKHAQIKNNQHIKQEKQKMNFYYHSQKNMQKYKKRISRKNFKESFQNLFLSRRIRELFSPSGAKSL